jgi:hypothetical protein
MIPTAIRVFPLGRFKEPEAFGTREKAFNFFCYELKSRENPPGRFNIPFDSKFIKGSLILFQYTERKDEEEIIAHAILISDGCVESNDVKDYVGYYHLDVDSINFYNTPVKKEDIFKIWRRCLYQRAKLRLDVSKYDDYMELLKRNNNLKSKCQ